MKPYKHSRRKDARAGLVRNLISNIILYEKIITTRPRAKSVATGIDRLISRSLDLDLAKRRFAKTKLYDRLAIKKLFEVIVPNAQQSPYRGFVQMYPLVPRQGDRASQVLVRLKPDIVKPIIPVSDSTKPEKRSKPTVKAVSSNNS